MEQRAPSEETANQQPTRQNEANDVVGHGSPVRRDSEPVQIKAEPVMSPVDTKMTGILDVDIKREQPRTQSPVVDADAMDVVMDGSGEHESEATLATLAASSASSASSAKLRKSHILKRMWEEREEHEVAEEAARPHRVPSMDEQARESLRRSIGLVLSHVGFHSATDEALESFLLMTETYFQSLAQDIVRVAHTARRTQPIPTDFDLSFARFNLSPAALRPHLRNPVAPSRVVPVYFDPLARLRLHGQAAGDLPLLGAELSGKAEKDARAYIPASFPDFPSIHTYRHTPVDVATVTVSGTGLRYDDGDAIGEEEDADANGPVSRHDAKRIREAAAVEAKQAEEALRSLMRASKINKLKEVRAAAERNMLSQQRHVLWEATMRELIEESTARTQPGRVLSAAALREEIADQSMMVNAEKVFYRKEIPRKPAKRVAQKT